MALKVSRFAIAVQSRQLARDAVRPQRGEELELHAARSFGPVVGQVDDLALPWAFDCGVRLVDKTLQPLGEPVIAAGLPELAVHPLLDNHPMAVVGDDEPMQVKLETVLHSRTVDLRYQAAGCGERGAVKAYPVPDIDQLVRRLPRIFPAPAADMDPELLL